jgi:hypothetical protein
MYKCPNCGNEDKFICGLVNVHSTSRAKRIAIAYCEQCNKYYLYENINGKVTIEPDNDNNRIELTKQEAMELIEKMKSCMEPRDIECKCPVHKFIHSFVAKNEHRMITI